MSDLRTKVDFNLIRYANCWEDPQILLKGLDIHAGDKILSIGSAGDNSFSLLCANPSLVVAVDVNVVQLYLIELKKVLIQLLDCEEVVQFLGYRESLNRAAIFKSIRPHLSTDARQYWDQHSELLYKGIIHEGKFEKYFKLFSHKILPFIHSTTDIETLLSPKDEIAQRRYYEQEWNTWRWRLFFKVFFSKVVMGKLGRDPEFLKEVNVPVGDYIFKKAARHLKRVQAQQNPFLRYNLTGDFGGLLPHYLQADNFNKIKTTIEHLQIRQGFAEEVCSEFGSFDGMNLSNIFEYMDKSLFRSTAEKLLANLNDKGRMAYWNLMVPRRISGVFPSEVRYLASLSSQLSQEDNGFFYNHFIVDQK